MVVGYGRKEITEGSPYQRRLIIGVNLLREFLISSFPGVDGLVTILECYNARVALFRGGIYRFEKDLKPEFFVLLCHLR